MFYIYDDLNRLQVAEEKVDGSTTWKQTFEIDRYGNRRFDTSTNGLTTTLGSCTEAVCNPTISTATNRLTTSGYAYDKNGNLTEDAEGKQFVYDAENHQTEVKSDQSVTIGEYLYDGDGRRVKKISSTETTIFVYDAGGQLVAEYSTQTAQDPKVSYLTTDHLGSPRIITNENGAVIDRKDYTAFGEESFTAERTSGLGYATTDEIRRGYTGYEKDNESGLDFAQARYYNSGHGRYTSVDPLTASASIRNPQTFNRYSYVLNSPYKFADPLGLLPLSIACGGSCPGSAGVSSGLIGLYSDNGQTIEIGIAGSSALGGSDFGEFTPTGTSVLRLEKKSAESITGAKTEIDGKQVFVQMEWDVTVGTLEINGERIEAALKGKPSQQGDLTIQVGGEIKYKLMDAEGGEFKGKEADTLKNKLKKIGKNSNLDNRANCHGATFAGGKYWIPNSSLTPSVLEKIGYTNVTGQTAQQDDVGLYKSGEMYVHSVRFNKDTATIRGKGGVEPYQPSVKLTDAWNKPGDLQLWRKTK